MENFDDEKVLDRISNPNVPATIDDYKELGQLAERVVNQVSGVIGNVTNTVIQVKEISAQVELELARMDKAIDALMIKAQRDIHIYEKSLPLLDKNFARCHDSMDKLMDRTIDLISNDLSEGNLQRQEAMMKLIEITNNQLNSLIAKLIPKY